MADFASMLYGTAQNAEQNLGAGLPQAVHQGAQLALQKEQLDMQQAKLQQQQQQLQNTKMEKLWDFVGKSANIQNAADRKNYLDMSEGYGNAMGLQVPKGAFKALGTDENMQRMSTLQTYMQPGPNGEPPMMSANDAIDLATNPLKRDKFVQLPLTPLEFMNKRPDLSSAQKEAVDAGIKMKEAQANRDLKGELAKDRASGQGGAADARLATQIRAQFKPLSEKQASLSSAMDARDRIAAALQKDPTGSTASAQDMGAMIYSVLHGELGRVNQTELASQLHLPGIENMAQDQIVKALGGVNPAVAKGLIQRVNTTAQELDAQKDRLKKSFELEAQGRAVPTAAMGAFNTGPTYRPMQTEQVQFNGRSWSRADLQKLIDAHPNDPKVADARKALGG